jgi:exosortase A-associated hydrolase 1
MDIQEHAFSFSCQGSWLYGVSSLPDKAASRGVLIVVGGPQYRVGSHRQFTLLARDLAAHGVPVMRFDYRGMGDSEGNARNFEEIKDDLYCPINQFFEKVQSLKELVIWGLCDAASAALLYAHQDRRVTGLVLLNPWVRTDEGIAKARLKHYYLDRFFEPEFWSKILRGNFNILESVQSFSRSVSTALLSRKENSVTQNGKITNESCNYSLLPTRMMDGLTRFEGRVLFITSGDDITAQEFTDLVDASPEWQKLFRSSYVKHSNIPEADHTFSRKKWRDQVFTWTREWVQSW